MHRIVRWGLVAAAVGGVCGFLALAAGGFTRREGGSLRFDPAVFRFNALLVEGQHRNAEVLLQNNTDAAVAVLGGNSFCGPRGCVDTSGYPQVIPPGGVGRFSIDFKAGQPGPFEHEIHFYTNRPGQAEVTARIAGSVVELNPSDPPWQPAPAGTAGPVEGGR